MHNYLVDQMAERHEKIGDFIDESLTQVVGQFAAQQPPSNLQNIVELMGQVAEKRMTEELQGDKPDIPDPMDSEISRLGKLDKHMSLQKRIQGHQSDMAASGQAQQLASQISGGPGEVGGGGGPEASAGGAPPAGGAPGGGTGDATPAPA